MFANGRRCDRATVDAWLASYRRHVRGGVHDAVMGALRGWLIERFASGSSDA